jgi:flagellin-like hook-associated protein FlgL
MRITNKMMIDNVAVNLSKQTQQLFEKQKMIATGKRINRISDGHPGYPFNVNRGDPISS